MRENNNLPNLSRRAFLTSATIAASTLAVGLRASSARDAQLVLSHLSDKNPMAAALHYTENAATVNRAQNSSYKPGDRCAGCHFFKGKAGEASGYAGCQIYPGYLVSADGWCASFAART